MKERLDALAREVLGDLAHVGIGVLQQELGAAYGFATAPGLSTWRGDSFLRVASISKIVTGQVAARAFGGNWSVDLGRILRIDAPKGVDLSLGAVLSHISGLSDAGGYAVDPMLPPDRLLERAVVGTAGLFDYCNLGYILAASAAEIRSNRSFGDLSRAWLARQGVIGGFNWFGLPPKVRQRAAALHRKGPESFIVQIDGRVPSAGIVHPDLSPDSTARNAAAFSPQGGLRTSLPGCLSLARRLQTLDATPLHIPAVSPSDPFDQYGAGIMVLRRPSFYPRPLIGHFANAYGLVAGVWHDAEADLSFAYVLDGLPFGDEDDALRPAERRIFEVISHLVPD